MIHYELVRILKKFFYNKETTNELLTDHETIEITKNQVVDFPTSMPPSTHTHTKSQITDFPTIPTKTSQLTNDVPFATTSQLDNKADSNHNHDSRYYTESEIDTKVTELNNGKAPTNHTHDDRYYTETEIDTIVSELNNSIDDKPNKNHASTGTTYGVGTANNYGHNKVINNLTQSSHQDGTSLSAYQGKVLKDQIDTKADNNHLHKLSSPVATITDGGLTIRIYSNGFMVFVSFDGTLTAEIGAHSIYKLTKDIPSGYRIPYGYMSASLNTSAGDNSGKCKVALNAGGGIYFINPENGDVYQPSVRTAFTYPLM